MNAPAVEPVSIDEVYLDLTGLEKLFGPPEAIRLEIKHRILEGTVYSAHRWASIPTGSWRSSDLNTENPMGWP
jgi:hypothetical protein